MLKACVKEDVAQCFLICVLLFPISNGPRLKDIGYQTCGLLSFNWPSKGVTVQRTVDI